MKAILAVLGAALVLSGMDAVADEEEIFSGKNQFRKNWMVTGWGGMEGKVNSEVGENKGKSSVEACFGSEVQPYSGITLQVDYGQDQKGNCIPLTDSLKSKGKVVLSLNAGKDREKAKSGPVDLQLTLSFVLQDGQTETISFAQAALPAKLDDKGSTWQSFEIPIEKMVKLAADPSAIVGINRIGIQYIDAPNFGFYVGGCVVTSK